MKLLVTGGSGLLGSAVVRAARGRSWEVAAPSRQTLDISDPSACSRVFSAEAPDWVIHCAAFTAVDSAEDNSEEAMRLNRDGASNVARAAVASASGLVYVSTDYVFDGAKQEPYLPDDPVSPIGAYARSKVAGEDAVTAVYNEEGAQAKCLIVRTGWLYGAGRRDFVDLVLDRMATGETLRIVDDQWGRPTWTRNVATVMLDLIDRGTNGIVHVNDSGIATWHEFAEAILAHAGMSGRPERISSRAFGARAERPLYSVLDLAATEGELQREMMPWREALRMHLDERSSA